MAAIRNGEKRLKNMKPSPRAGKPEPTLEQQFAKWWPKCLDRFAVADHQTVKEWIHARTAPRNAGMSESLALTGPHGSNSPLSGSTVIRAVA